MPYDMTNSNNNISTIHSKVEHFVKDLEIALDEARRMQLCLPGLALAHQFYVALKSQGHGRLGTQALLLTLERLNNVELPARTLSNSKT